MLTKDHLWLGLPVFVVMWRNLQFGVPLVDFWWHLKLGELIATTGSIPAVDLFSYTASGRPYFVHNWLAELIYYGTYSLGGLSLVVMFNTLVALGAFLPLYFLCVTATSVRAAAALGVLAAVGIPGTIRPQVFSYLMFSVYYWALTRYRQRQRDVLWTLPLLMVLWVNLHGAFIMGLGLLAVFIGCEGLRRFVDRKSMSALTNSELRKLACVLALCVLATLVNPAGYNVYEYLRTVMADQASQQLVSEWQRPRINDPGGIVVFYLPLILTAAAFLFARSKPDLTELGVFAAFAVFGFMSLRNGPWFTIVAYPLFARYASGGNLPGLDRMRRFLNGATSASPPRPAVRPSHRPMNLVLACAAGFVLVLQTPWIRPAVYHTSLVQEGTPVRAMDFIEEHQLAGNIFHPQMFGDYLIWRLWPEHKSFIDGRVHLFGLEFVNEYFSIYHDPDWERRLDKWNVRYLLLSTLPGQDDSLQLAQAARHSSRWRTLYEDDVAVLLERKATY
jgi:hypothetical protein